MVTSSILINYHAERPYKLIDAVSAAEPPPSELTRPKVINSGSDIRTLISYTGSLTSVTLQLWIQAGGAAGVTWYKGEGAELDPTLGPISIDWPLGDPTRFHIQVSELTGTGTVTVLAYNLQLGTGSRRP